MTTIKLAQGFTFLDSRLVPGAAGPALAVALTSLVAAIAPDFTLSTEARLEIEETSLAESPAIVLRCPPFAWVLSGAQIEALDEALAAAYAALAAQDAADEAARAALPRVRRQATRTILDRLTPDESAALLNSTAIGIRLLVLKAVAEGFIRDDDPDFPAARAGLDALGIIAADRWDALFAA
jgi:hypothetical protein